MDRHAPWHRSFRIDGGAQDGIELTQIDPSEFLLRSRIEYVGARTGLEGRVREEVLAAIRVVTPETLPRTDLASVPAPAQWFVNRYGVHTPAALIHDALIGAERLPAGMTEPYADRYFRFMLADLGVPWLRRWLMWTAVALRTRFAAGGVVRWSVVLWVLASMVGMTSFALAWRAGDWPALAIATFAPFVFAGLWGRQYGAGLIAAYTAPWVLPPTAFGALGFVAYRLLEAAAERVAGSGADPARPRTRAP
jgi:hypothetical protein